jgi:hypothetical protein
MNTALKRKNPASDKGAHDIISGGLVILLKPFDVLHNLIRLLMRVLRVIKPIDPRRFTGNICREVNQVLLAGIFDIEESSLPLLARF